MFEKGYVYDVRNATAGSNVSINHPAGATVLLLEDAVDFNEEGGSASIDGVVYEYVSADVDADTITLSTPLAVSLEPGDAVAAYPRIESKEALVVVEGYEDAITARVPYALIDRLPLGIREDYEREYVGISDDTGEWVVTDAYEELRVDGSYIDKGTLPDPKATDGVPPTSSPVPVLAGAIGALFVRWTPVLNRDPVKYEVHVSMAPVFVPDLTTLHSTTTGASATIRTLPNGAGLLPNTDYYVCVIARDDDGAAGPSSVAGAQTVQVTGPDIAANYVYAGNISVGQLSGGTLNAEVTLASKIKTADSGARVELSADGITVFRSDNTPTTLLASTGESTFKGQVEASNLTVVGDTILRGSNNELSQSGVIRLFVPAVGVGERLGMTRSG